MRRLLKLLMGIIIDMLKEINKRSCHLNRVPRNIGFKMTLDFFYKGDLGFFFNWKIGYIYFILKK